MVQTTEALLLLAWVHCTVNFMIHPGGGARNYLNYAVKQIAQLWEMGLRIVQMVWDHQHLSFQNIYICYLPIHKYKVWLHVMNLLHKCFMMIIV